MKVEMVWTELFGLGICFLEGYIYFFLLSHFSKHRFNEKWVPVTVVGILMLGVFDINQFGIANLNLMASLTLCMVLCQILSIPPVKKKIFYVLLCCFIVLCGELVMMVIFCPYPGNETIELNNGPRNPLMLVLSSKSLAFMVIRIICHISDNRKFMSSPSLAPYPCCFPIACLMVCVGTMYSNISFLNPKFPTVMLEIGCVLLLTASIILFVIYDRMVSVTNRVKEHELIGTKSRLENQHYLQIEEVNRKHSEIIHDVGNYLQTVGTLALEGNNEKIVDIIDSLNHHIVKIEEEHYCSHQILNAILNGKRQETLIKKADYNVYVELGFKKSEAEDTDLISIMSNLIDNAIEAANKYPNGFVDAQMYKANNRRFTAIKIANNYLEQLVEKDDEFITRKQNPTMHGIGTRDMKKIVECYGGWTNIEYDKDESCAATMFA